jgi:hypothetical protein
MAVASLEVGRGAISSQLSVGANLKVLRAKACEASRDVGSGKPRYMSLVLLLASGVKGIFDGLFSRIERVFQRSCRGGASCIDTQTTLSVDSDGKKMRNVSTANWKSVCKSSDWNWRRRRRGDTVQSLPAR